MNIFILTTGRAGSVSIIRACRHVTNFSAAHESRCHLLGDEHFDYAENHIEADNRLTWFLGGLQKKYGDEAFYVHLIRDEEATARSFNNRYHSGIIEAYRKSILLEAADDLNAMDVCRDYCRTVHDNIEAFLRDKTNTMEIRLERVEDDFPEFWSRVGAEGDLEASMAEWEVPKNISKQPPAGFRGVIAKSRRIARKLPEFIRGA